MKIPIPDRCTPSWVAIWSLRIVVALQCVGVAGQFVLSEYESESDVYGFLFFDCGWSEPVSQLVDDVGAYGCLVAAVVLLVNGIAVESLAGKNADSAASKMFRWVDVGVLLFIATWAFALSATHAVRGGAFAELTIGEQAVRFSVPIALLVLLRGLRDSSEKLVKVGVGILAIATAMTFAVHGYMAQQLYGPFVDLILLTDQRMLHLRIEQATVERILAVVGWVDIVLAGLLLTTRWRFVVVYMTLWGLITALSRISAFGIVAWPETLVRAANAGAPFGLLLLVRYLANARQSELRSDI